jgi:DNA-directed RNA polymerase specialized sigma24 family protein
MGIENPITNQDAWLGGLRARFVEIARGRVHEGAVEDVVQDALAIVFQKAGALGEGRGDAEPPPLPWCFRVLRNVIGNHYQKERTRLRAADPASETHAGIAEFTSWRPNPTPVEAIEQHERARLLREAIDELAAEDDFCWKHFQDVLAGGRRRSEETPSEAAVSTVYVRFFRCREKLRRILLRRGYLP